jgi:hypothetical protein
MRNLNTAIYVRVSTEEQAQEGYSIRGQTEKLKSYALLKEWDIYDIYADGDPCYGLFPKTQVKPINMGFSLFQKAPALI